MMSTSVNKKTTEGFTLVELSTSLAYISILLLSIAMLVLQISSIYNKGFTIREVDQAGQAISRELQTSLRNSTSVDTKSVTFTSGSETLGGRLCVNNIVYAWNYRDTIAKTNPQSPNYRTVGGSRDNNVRFVKQSGSLETYCNQKSDGSWTPLSGAVELQSSGNANIAISDFKYSSNKLDNSQTIHSIDMVVGTSDVGLIKSNGNCDGSDRRGDEQCAVNYFSFTARSGNEQNGGDS